MRLAHELAEQELVLALVAEGAEKWVPSAEEELEADDRTQSEEEEDASAASASAHSDANAAFVDAFAAASEENARASASASAGAGAGANILLDNVMYPQLHQWIFLRSVHVYEEKYITMVKTKMH
jgi:hypothetical protein